MAKIPAPTQFAICISNQDCDDLLVWKLYRVIPDADAESEDYVRVVDESGEDYLYPVRRFVLVEMPADVTRKILSVASVA